MRPGSKYRPLYNALSNSGQSQVILTFGEIEGILGEALPPSSRRTRGWWSNRQYAPQAKAWMNAGYHVLQVSLETERVTFGKPVREYQVQREGSTILWNREMVRALRQYMEFSQSRFAEELGVRQQTVSEWETGSYAPSRAMCKYLTIIAERAGFTYGE